MARPPHRGGSTGPDDSSGGSPASDSRECRPERSGERAASEKARWPGEQPQGPLSTGLFTIKYPVKEEAEGSRTRLKSGLFPERSTKLSLYSGDTLLLRSQSARPESLIEGPSKEEPESAPASPTRKKPSKFHTKAVAPRRWASCVRC